MIEKPMKRMILQTFLLNESITKTKEDNSVFSENNTIDFDTVFFVVLFYKPFSLLLFHEDERKN